MPHKKNTTKSRYTKELFILLPITGALFLKKQIPKESLEENSIDFHVQMIKKIDTLIKENEPETPEETTSAETPTQPLHVPIELRSPLNRTLGHVEFQWDQPLPTQVKTRTIPEEFKTEFPLSLHPQFTFISTLDFQETILKRKPRAEKRVEIIDLATLQDSITTTSLTIAKQQSPGKQSTTKTKVTQEKPSKKKMEVIDTRAFPQKTYEDVFMTAMKQSEAIEKKSQIYYLNSKDYKEKKQKTLDIKQTYIPVDFDERSKELKEQQQHEEKEKQQHEQKIQKQLEHEHEKLEKLQSKKAKLVEKKHQLKLKEKKETKKEQQHPHAKHEAPPGDKEQKRLQRQQIQLARIEERKRKKEGKKALKLKQKQQRQKPKQKDKKQHNKKEKHSVSLFKKEKQTGSLELDDDLKKVLLITDSLLGELPEGVIDRFAQSEDFRLYERILNKYNIK